MCAPCPVLQYVVLDGMDVDSKAIVTPDKLHQLHLLATEYNGKLGLGKPKSIVELMIALFRGYDWPKILSGLALQSAAAKDLARLEAVLQVRRRASDGHCFVQTCTAKAWQAMHLCRSASLLPCTAHAGKGGGGN